MSVPRPDLPYKIVVEGHLDPGRAAALGDLQVIHNQEGTTTLLGPVADQAALYGLITRLRDMGVKLVTVQQLDIDPE